MAVGVEYLEKFNGFKSLKHLRLNFVFWICAFSLSIYFNFCYRLTSLKHLNIKISVSNTCYSNCDPFPLTQLCNSSVYFHDMLPLYTFTLSFSLFCHHAFRNPNLSTQCLGKGFHRMFTSTGNLNMSTHCLEIEFRLVLSSTQKQASGPNSPHYNSNAVSSTITTYCRPVITKNHPLQAFQDLKPPLTST